MIAAPDANVLSACRTLFGERADVSREFVLSLRKSDIKTAFRRRAKETHPDLFSAENPDIQQKQAELFRVVNDAYEIMRKYCEKRDRARARVSAPRRKPAPSATPSFRVDNTGWLFRGQVPSRRLEIGRYLYYRGCVPYHVLIKALAWQMRQRPPVGSIAKRWGWLNETSVKIIMQHRGQPLLFGERAAHLGLLTPYQTKLLLAYQRTIQKRLGRYFVDHGYLSEDEVEALAADLRRHNARFPLPNQR